MPYKEKEIEKRYWTIGEVAKGFGVATSLLRFWGREFPQIKIKLSKALGNRQYTAKDVDLINEIYQLVKVRGFTLEGAQRQLDIQAGMIPKKEERWDGQKFIDPEHGRYVKQFIDQVEESRNE